MDTTQIPVSYSASATFAVWNPSLPTIQQSRKDAIESIQANFQYINDTLMVGGYVSKIGDTMTGSLAFENNNAGTGGHAVTWKVNGLNRWSFLSSVGNETGGDAGSVLRIDYHNDAGALKGTALSIDRVNGTAVFGGLAQAATVRGRGQAFAPATPTSAQVHAYNDHASAGDAAFGFQSGTTGGSLRLVRGTRNVVAEMADGEGATIKGSRFESAVKTYAPAGAATATLQTTISNAFFVSVPAGGCAIAFEATLNPGTVYRVTLHTTGNGTVTWPGTVVFAANSPALNAGPDGSAIVSLVHSNVAGKDYATVSAF